MKNILRRGLAMLMSVIMTLSLFVGYLPTEAFAEETTYSSNSVQPRAVSQGNVTFDITGDETLTYIGDSCQLAISKAGYNGWDFSDSPAATTWSIASGEQYATVGADGRVTAKKFAPLDDSEHTVTVCAETTFYRFGRQFTGSRTIDLTIQYEKYDIYYYARIPGSAHDKDPNKEWYGLVKAKILGAPAPTEGDTSWIQYEITDIGPYPTITYNDVNYTYGAATNGYTLTPSQITVSYGANEGNNKIFKEVSSGEHIDGQWVGNPVYHFDHTLTFTDHQTIKDLQVQFKVKQPGDTGFTSDPNKATTVPEGTEISKVIFPNYTEKTYNGLNYEFHGWYMDENCTVPVKNHLNDAINENIAFYGKYEPTQGKVKIDVYYDGKLGNSEEKVVKTGSYKLDQNIIYQYAGDTYTFKETNPRDGTVDVTAGGTETIKVYYVSKHGVSYTITTPPGTTAPEGGMYGEGEEVTVERAPTVEGWTFQGWKLTSGNPADPKDTYQAGDTFTMPDSDVEFTGTYTKKTYTVTYTVGGEQAGEIETYKYGDDVTLRETPQPEEGYRFDGWKVAENSEGKPTLSTGSFTMPDGNVVLTGEFKKIGETSYTIEFYCGTGWNTALKESVTVTDGAKVGDVINVTEYKGRYVEDNYLFDHAENHDGSRVESITLEEDASKNVLKIYYEHAQKIYTINYEVRGGPTHEQAGLPTKEYTDSRDFTPKEPKEVSGYKLESTVVSGANWSKVLDCYLIKSGSDSATVTVTYMPLEAVYKVEHYQQNADGTYPTTASETESLTGVIGTPVTATPNSYENYTVDTETTGSQDKGTVAESGNTVLKVYYKRDAFKVNYLLDGVAYEESAEYRFGSDVSVKPDPTNVPVGYEFSGWTYQKDDTTPTNPFTMPTEDVTLVGTIGAKDVGYKIDYYQQDVTGETYTKVGTENKPGVTGAQAKVEPDQNKYTGFHLSTDKQSVTSDLITGDGQTTLEVYYDRNICTVRYVLTSSVQGVTAPDPVSVRYGDTVQVMNLKIPEGYEFYGWKVGNQGEPVTVIPEISDNVTLVGECRPILYKVYFKHAGPTIIYHNSWSDWEESEHAQEKAPGPKVGDEIHFPVAASKPGYKFTGWLTTDVEDDGSKTIFAADGSFKMPPRNVTLTAQYTANTDTKYTIKYYVETFDSTETARKYAFYRSVEHNDGTTDELIKLLDGSTPADKFALKELGLVYAEGNNGDPTEGKVAAGGTLVLKLYYNRESYSVTYSVTGINYGTDEIPPVVSYKYGQTVAVAAQLSAQGYDFTGWTTTSNLGNTGKTQFGDGDSFKMPAGNVTFTGSFTASDDTTYYIKYHFQEVTPVATIDGEPTYGYIVDDELTKEGKATTGTWVKIAAGTDFRTDFSGFSFNAGQSTTTHLITADGRATFDLYFDRLPFAVTYVAELPDGTAVTVPDPANHRFGSTVKVEPDLTVVGYKFRGWTTSDAEIVDGTPKTFTMPAKPVTLMGSFEEVRASYSIEYYWLNEASGDYEFAGYGDTKNPVRVGTSASLTEAERTAYNGAGFVVDHTEPGNGTITIQENVQQNVIKVYLKKAEYAVRYDVMLPAGISEKPTLPTESWKNFFDNVTVGAEPEIPGYRFNGWETQDGKTTNNNKTLFMPSDPFTMPANDVKFMGSYTLNQYGYTVNHYLIGTTTPVPGTQVETGTMDFGSTKTVKLSDLHVLAGYSLATTEDQTITIDADENKNVINIYYYKDVTVKANDASKVYGDADPELTATVTGLLGNDTIKYTVARAQGKDARTYDITPTGSKTQNYYKVSYENGTFKINPRIVTIKTDGYNDMYDGEAHSAEVVVKVDGVVTDGIALEYDIYDGKDDGWMDNAPTVTNVADGTVRVAVRPKGDNYKLDGTNPAFGYTLTVTPRDVTLTSAGAEKVYDGTALTKNAQTDVTVSGSGFVKDEGVESYSFNATASLTDVGTNSNGFSYQLKANTDPHNYNITVNPGTLKVTARPITLLGESREVVYDGSEKQIVTYEVDTTENKYDLAAGDTISGLWYEAKGTNVGSYKGTFGGMTEIKAGTKDVTTNYAVTYKPGKLTIKPSTALSVSGTRYEAVYDGAAHGEAATVSGPTTGVTVEYSVDGGAWTQTAPQITDVGTKTVKVKASCPNYNDAEAEYTLTVHPREIAVTGRSAEVIYNGEEQSVSGFDVTLISAANGSALIFGHEINITDHEAKGTDASTTAYSGAFIYEGDAREVKITSGGTDVTGNYDITVKRGSLTINKRPITIKPVDVTATYDGQVHGATAYEYVGDSLRLVEGDTLNVRYSEGIMDAGKVTSSLTATEGSARTADGNYDIKTETGTVEVTKRALTLTGNADAVTFNGATQSVEGFTVGTGQLVSGQQLGSVSYRAEGRNAGTYTGRFTGTPVILSGSKDVTANYDIDTQDSTLTISPARLTVRSESANKVYDGEALTNGRVTVTLEGQAITAETVPGRVGTVTLPNGETVGILVNGTQTQAGSSTNTGAISWNGSSNGSFTALASNYISSFEYGRLTVTDSEDEIVVTTTGGVFTYDGLPHGAAVTVSELPEGYTLERAVSSATAQTVLDGTVAATCDELVIRNEQGEDVTDELNIRYVNSTLIIERAPLYITTLSATKEYDGEPLTAGVTVTGLVNNETISVMPTGSQTEIGSSQNGYHVAWVGTARVYNYEIEETLGTLTVVPVGQVPAPQALDEGDNPPDVRVVETMLLEDEIVPLAGNTEKCCILHFLLALAALATVLISGHDTKKLQEKITELKKKETPENGADDSRMDGGKDDN